MRLDLPDWVSVSKAAEVLGLHRRYIYRLIKKGHLTAMQAGERATVVSRESIEKELTLRAAAGKSRVDESLRKEITDSES